MFAAGMSLTEKWQFHGASMAGYWQWKFPCREILQDCCAKLQRWGILCLLCMKLMLCAYGWLQNDEIAPHVAASPEDSARRDSYTYTPTEVIPLPPPPPGMCRVTVRHFAPPIVPLRTMSACVFVN